MKINSGQAPSTLVPKYIGSDFDHVVTVSKNIDYVKNVAEGIEGLSVISYIGEEPPTQPSVGSSWYCTTDGRTYVWYKDEDSYQWVESSPQSAPLGLQDVREVAIANTERQMKLLGYDLVKGSFEEGALLSKSTDVALYKHTGGVYKWKGVFPAQITAKSSPTGTGISNWEEVVVPVLEASQVTEQVQTKLLEVIDNAQRVIETVGYNFIGDYASGLMLNSTKDMISYEGLRYANSGPFPKTATGNFSVDGPWALIPMATGAFLFAFVASAGQTTYQISAPISPGTAPFVFRRGVYQQFGIAYTISPLDGRTFQFSQPLDAGDEVQIIATTGSDSVIKGDYQAFLYRNSATAPSAPSGQNPSGWVSSPVTPADDEFTYVSTIRKSGSDGAIIGSWSAPSRFSGSRGIKGIQGGQGIQGVQGEVGPQGATGPQGKSVVDVVEVSSNATSITYKFELSDGSFTPNYAVPKGASVQELELVSKIGKVATYRFLLTTGGYTNTFVVNDGLDGTGSVVSVNGISPDVSGDVTLTPADIGADAAGTATGAVASHVALADPHTQYDYRWSTTMANTGELSGSKRVRWLADTSSARNRTIGPDVTDLLVKDATGKAGTNKVTITAPVGKTINGAATEVIDANFGWAQYTLVGTDFKTTGGQ